MSDFSNKAAFLRHVDAMIPDDAHWFEFTLSFNTCAGTRPAAVPGAKLEEGLRVHNVERTPVDIQGRMARYKLEGAL